MIDLIELNVNQMCDEKYLSLLMDTSESTEKQSVLGHGIDESRQWEEGAEQRGGHTGQCPHRDDDLGPAHVVVTEGIGQRRLDVDVGPGHHERERRADADVAQRHHRHRHERRHRYREARVPRFLARCRYAAFISYIIFFFI